MNNACDCPCLPISIENTLIEWNKLRVWPSGAVIKNNSVPVNKLKTEGGRRTRRRQRGGGFRLIEADIPGLSYFQKNKMIKNLEDATIIRQLGEGNFGVVELIELPNGHKVVKKRMKYFIEDCFMDKLVKREISILKTLTVNPSTRPYVCNFIGALYYADPTIIEKVFCCIKPTKKIVDIYIQYIEGISLYDYMNSLIFNTDINPIIALPKIINGLYEGLSAIHKAGYIHSDIKPENIFITYNDTPIFIDFGFSVKRWARRLGSTPEYTPSRQYVVNVFSRYALPYLDYYALDKSVNVLLSRIRDAYDDEKELINTQIQALPIDWAFVGSTFRSLEDGTFNVNGPLGLGAPSARVAAAAEARAVAAEAAAEAAEAAAAEAAAAAAPNGVRHRKRTSSGTRKRPGPPTTT